MPRTLVEKVQDAHVVATRPTSVLGIDLHLLHEVTSPQAFAGLKRRGVGVRHPGRCFATVDHSLPTRPGSGEPVDPRAAEQLVALERSCAEHGIPFHGPGSDRQGIVHVIGPELGLTQPGMTIACGDSHSATHGAFGALGFGIGTSQVEQVLATQALITKRLAPHEVRFEGRLPEGVEAKDLALAFIARVGVNAGVGHAFEYRGPVVERLSMDERMTLCNMSIEAGAKAGLVAPDDTTFEYLEGRPFAPVGAAWDEAVTRWRTLRSDDDATYRRSTILNVDELEPRISYGTDPSQSIGLSEVVPDPDDRPAGPTRDRLRKALSYIGVPPGQSLLGHPIDVVFIGSCTNARLSDLRTAARVFEGRAVAPGVRTLVVPGSQAVRRAAEAEGLAAIFERAGAEWHRPGCSLCIAMNGDRLLPGQLAVSTSNRNFEGRQGPGGRTLLASPSTAAASAVSGQVADARALLAAPIELGSCRA
ncbi:MAG: 3-isopropylmalate dehydratase large subunit [Acidobacteriota bacterium]